MPDLSVNVAGLREVEKLNDAYQQLSNEVDRLATFILMEYPDEPGRNGKSESAVDVAIRLLTEKR